MGDRHPLGHAGGARGVDEVGDVVGGRRRQAPCSGRLSIAGSSTSMTSRSHPSSRDRRPGGGDRGDRRGVGEHELDPGRRQRRVDRQIRRPGLEHRQNRHDRLSRPGQQQRHTLPRARAMAGQQVRQPVGGLLELPVGQRAAPAADRHRLRGARHLRGEQHRNRHRRGCGLGQHRPVTDLIQPGVLSLIEQIHRRQPPCRVGGHRHQHPLQPLDERLDAVRVEHVGVVFDAKAQFSRPGVACTVSG